MRREMGFRRSIIAPILGVATAALMSIGAAQPASANEVSPMAHPSGCHFEVQAPWGRWPAAVRLMEATTEPWSSARTGKPESSTTMRVAGGTPVSRTHTATATTCHSQQASRPATTDPQEESKK